MYDVVIHLEAEYCPRAYQKLDLSAGTFLSHYREYDSKIGEKTFPIVDFDPVKSYVKQLRETFSEFALFFYDTYGATDIYVLWKPKAFEKKDFKIQNINGRTLDSSGKKLIPNIEAIIEDFKIIGHELVKEIIIRTEKLANFQ
jgi:U3 small nucleolar RNA-associated protein 22